VEAGLEALRKSVMTLKEEEEDQKVSFIIYGY
jgi:hypothetical protein